MKSFYYEILDDKPEEIKKAGWITAPDINQAHEILCGMYPDESIMVSNSNERKRPANL